MKNLTRPKLILAVVLILVTVLMSLPLPFYSREWHKLMHVLGAILFIGNIVTAAVWMTLARFSQQVKVIHFAAKGVNLADVLFTIPGIILIALNGTFLAPGVGGGNVLGASWVAAALLLFILSGIVWGGFLLRYQSQLVQLSASGEQLSSEFASVFKKWSIWGVVATILPILSLILMIFKPALWD